MIEINGIMPWIYGKLSGSSDITTWVRQHPTESVWNIYEQSAIQGATYPMIVVTMLSSQNKIGGSGRRIFTKALYQIKAIDEHPTSYAGVAPIANIIDGLFQQDQNVVDPVIIGVTPMRAIQEIEFVDGKRRNIMGIEAQFFAYNESGS